MAAPAVCRPRGPPCASPTRRPADRSRPGPRMAETGVGTTPRHPMDQSHAPTGRSLTNPASQPAMGSPAAPAMGQSYGTPPWAGPTAPPRTARPGPRLAQPALDQPAAPAGPASPAPALASQNRAVGQPCGPPWISLAAILTASPTPISMGISMDRSPAPRGPAPRRPRHAPTANAPRSSRRGSVRRSHADRRVSASAGCLSAGSALPPTMDQPRGTLTGQSHTTLRHHPPWADPRPSWADPPPARLAAPTAGRPRSSRYLPRVSPTPPS